VAPYVEVYADRADVARQAAPLVLKVTADWVSLTTEIPYFD